MAVPLETYGLGLRYGLQQQEPVRWAPNFNMPGLGAGDYHIIESAEMTQEAVAWRTRSWRERLFTRPWRPLKVKSQYTAHVPMQDILCIPGSKLLIMHPNTARRLREEVDRRNDDPQTVSKV